jgi:hypothetical protein
MLGSAVGSTLAYGLPSGRENFAPEDRRRDGVALAAERVKDHVPPHARLSVDNLLGAHFARRPYIVEFPLIGEADWILATTDRHRIVRSHGTGEDYYRRLAELLEDPAWQVAHHEPGVVLLRAVEAGPEPDPRSDVPMRLALTLLSTAVVLTVAGRRRIGQAA